MAVLPTPIFHPTPFFADKNRAFWTLQLGGWSGAMLLRAMSALAGGQSLDFLVVIFIATVTGLSISLILSVIYRQLISKTALVTWGLTAIILLLAVGLHAFIDAWVQTLYRPQADAPFFQRFLGYFYIDLTLLGAWSALYYAINYFLQVEEQADRLIRLETQATSAQLAMLRYQLNPHFLFNTLNSISTLVLLKQTKPANAMLTRLSGFLRHTLVTQPGGKVTLAQEIETLKLYLEIERMRFEERLRTQFDIDPNAVKAVLPSMLLQPLIENAIKYAVSPQEEGAQISLTAKVAGGRLRIVVADTGPGIHGHEQRATHRQLLPSSITGNRATDTSTGVGLPNIRDRLAQAYGDEHRFEIRTPPEGGFTVIIEIPHEEDASEGDSRKVAALTARPAPAASQAGDQANPAPSPSMAEQQPPDLPSGSRHQNGSTP